MSNPSTLILERNSLRLATITFSNPPANVTVVVDAVADVPSLATAPAAGNEDSAIALAIASSLTDTDGSEALAIRITGVPTGAALSAGTNLGGGVWQLNAGQLAGLTLTPPPDFSGAITLGVTATSTETPTDGETNLLNNVATTTASLVVSVAPVSDPPGLVVQDVGIVEDAGAGPAPLAIALTPGAPGETAWIVVSDIPAGVTFNVPGDATGLPPGSLKFTAADFHPRV